MPAKDAAAESSAEADDLTAIALSTSPRLCSAADISSVMAWGIKPDLIFSSSCDNS